ncbi:hypothetical protein BC332_34177 [Capsicum chinense]|nr:hypothetical protein BC332_34177 [Capsicum chinense]
MRCKTFPSCSWFIVMFPTCEGHSYWFASLLLISCSGSFDKNSSNKSQMFPVANISAISPREDASWDAKEHLAALADKLGSSLTEIDLSVKSPQASADAAEQDVETPSNRALCKDRKVIPSENLSTQHRLLVMDLGIKKNRKRRTKECRPRIKWGGLTPVNAWEIGERFYMLFCARYSYVSSFLCATILKLDYDEKAEDAVDYEDIDEQYEGPEVQTVTEEDLLLPKKDYFSTEVSLTTLENRASVFDDENYDEDDNDEKEQEVVENTAEAQSTPGKGEYNNDASVLLHGEKVPEEVISTYAPESSEDLQECMPSLSFSSCSFLLVK